MMLKPGQPLPNLDLPLAGGGRFSLKAEKPDAFTMLVFYPGLHWPICKTYLADPDAKIGAFKEKRREGRGGDIGVLVNASPEWLTRLTSQF